MILLKNKGIVILTVLLLSVLGMCYGQQNSQYTQYMYNTQSINPAYAGSREVLSLNGVYRSQWVGLDGAPKTFDFSMNTPLGYSKLGLGLGFNNDQIGPTVENTITTDLSYTINLSNYTKLGFGVKAGLNLFDFNPDKLNYEIANDPNLVPVNEIDPIIGAGAYLYNDRWYIGLSAPNLLETKRYDDSQSDSQISIASERMHFYAIGGYVFDLSYDWQFKPTVLVKAVSGAPLAVDLSGNFQYDQKLTLGLAYRWDASVSALAGFQISDQIMVGYAYDYDTTPLGNYNAGSHELFLRFELFTKVRKVVNPRFF
ncbi:PorP/SprF family type IX secretion system membrane protein [Galbibacter mesophilus]|uniref:PorP/SprF family type IX secretion system membrane protein n=1 Tax=Galbibacter mesophilus TaxID=379069 RepID=UPI00191F98DD|nr:type IX secretion system membrane protein PorP/SprF [Galbibacter mesophilus]MCM5661356.1 type IX secretion system membrane protein PorP/SprF [Galbibacter mesophilus]